MDPAFDRVKQPRGETQSRPPSAGQETVRVEIEDECYHRGETVVRFLRLVFVHAIFAK